MAQEIIVPQSYGNGPTSLGTVEQIQQAALAQQAQAASLAQAQNLARARLSGIATPNVGPIPQATLSAPQQSFLSQLSAPAQPLALEAGAPMTQAGRVNALRSQVANNPSLGQFAERQMPNVVQAPGMAEQLTGDVNALRGTAGLGGAPTGTAAAAGEGGLLSQLRAGVTGSGGLSDALALTPGAGVMGAAKTLGARAGAGTLFALAPNAIGMGVEAFGPQIEDALGLAKGSTKGAAQAGADVGTGALVGTMIFPGPGTLVGAALGGLKDIVPLAGELVSDITGSGVAQQWGKATGQFNKIITKTNTKNIGKQGVKYLNENYYPAGQEIMRQAKAGEITHDAAVAGMQKLNKMMQSDIVKLRNQHATGTTSKRNRTAVQIQMGQAMEKLAAGSRLQGAAAQSTLNNLAADPNMAAVAPILQASGELRNQWGNTMADAYTGAAYLDIPEKRLDAKLAEMRQLQQQIAAQKASTSGSGSSSLASLAAQVK